MPEQIAPEREQLARYGLAGRYVGSRTSARLKVTGIALFSAGDFMGGAGAEEIVLPTQVFVRAATDATARRWAIVRALVGAVAMQEAMMLTDRERDALTREMMAWFSASAAPTPCAPIP